MNELIKVKGVVSEYSIKMSKSVKNEVVSVGRQESE